MSGKDSQHNLPVQSSEDVAQPPQDAPRSQSPKWRRWMVPSILSLAILGIVGWVAATRFIIPLIAISQMKSQATPVPLANPKSTSIEDSSDYAANLDSRQSVTLQPRVSGQISAIYVKPGDRVEAGKPLLQIDSAQQQAQVASRQAAAQTAAADVAAAQADVGNTSDTLRSLEARRASAQADVQLNQKEYERFAQLVRVGASSRQVLDQRLNTLRTSQAALGQIEAEIQAQRSAINRAQATVLRNQRAVEQAKANIAEGQAQLQYYTITAPFAGVVGNIPVKPGDVVSNTSQLLTVTQNQRLEIQIQIPLERASALRIGLPVKLLNDKNEEIQTGQISFIAPNVDPGTQSVQVKAVFDNVGDRLRASQFVRARVVWNTRPGVLVPTTAISRLGGRDFIFAAAPFQNSGCEAPAQSEMGGRVDVTPDLMVAVQKPIKLGKIVGNDQEVLDGLNASDRIVTSGILQLQNCAPIADATKQ
jgi:multidrug efflux pump subunit AcrA (membrane-fusion protein)